MALKTSTWVVPAAFCYILYSNINKYVLVAYTTDMVTRSDARKNNISSTQMAFLESGQN